MTFDELTKHITEVDRFAGKEPFSNPHGTIEVAILRATLEVAAQLAYLNENGVGLAGVATRGQNLCVSIEQNIGG